MRFINKLFAVAAIAAMFSSCKKEDDLSIADDLLGLGGDTWTQTSIDKWLYDSLTKPHNIAVKYKWDQFEFDVSRTLVPPDEAQVVPLWQVLKRAWIDPFVAEAGLVFFNKYSPKTFVLSGGNSYNDNGSVILGTAEGGRKIVLYAVNDFRVKGMPGYTPATDSSFIKTWFLQTIQHEFAHILHQNVMYSQDFKKVNPALYNGNNWINVSNALARRDGFITAYASSGYDDDFADMVAILLVEGRGGFDKIIADIPTGTSANGTTQAAARSYLRQKEAFVVSYFKQVWSIDFYSLQNKCRTALSQFL
jgi:substrate import-associated zinc metallohydrolase lipoprotein